jgi:hypothetical protein
MFDEADFIYQSIKDASLKNDKKEWTCIQKGKYFFCVMNQLSKYLPILFCLC